MSMNMMQRARMARQQQGMGLIFPDEPAVGGGGVFNGGGSWDWGNLIKGTAFTLSNIFGKPANTQAAYQQPNPNLSTNPNTLSVADQLAIIEAQRRAREEEIGSGSISSKGIKFGDTTISWPAIALAAGVFYLVQMQGFQRRGRY